MQCWQCEMPSWQILQLVVVRHTFFRTLLSKWPTGSHLGFLFVELTTSTFIHRLPWNFTINNYMVGSCARHIFPALCSKWQTLGHLGLFSDCYETSQSITTWWVDVRDTFFSTSHSKWPTGGHHGFFLWSELLQLFTDCYEMSQSITTWLVVVTHFFQRHIFIHRLLWNFTINNYMVGSCAWHIFFNVAFKMADRRPFWIFKKVVEQTTPTFFEGFFIGFNEKLYSQ